MIARSKKNIKKDYFSNIFFSILFGLLLLGALTFLIITNIKIEERRKTFLLKIDNLQAEIQVLEDKNKKLRENIVQSETPEYLEKVAREQFNLKAPGEEVVVISKEKKQEENKGEVNFQEGKRSFWDPRNWWEWLKNKF